MIRNLKRRSGSIPLNRVAFSPSLSRFQSATAAAATTVTTSSFPHAAASNAVKTDKGLALYPHVFQPLKVAHVTLRNRIVMGSMHTGMEEVGLFGKGRLDDLAAYFAERAKAETGLMVTGGIAPNAEGRTAMNAATMTSKSDAAYHKVVTDAVHEHGGAICMQILHTGRYAFHFSAVSASPIKAPIGFTTPRELSNPDVYATVRDFVKCAEMAKLAGYDGVEIMGSEGYLINQFLVKKTNLRTDEFGGSYENRMRLALDIVRQTRLAVGPDFVIIFRLSMLDLVSNGSSWEEIVELAQRLEASGASIINTGIGWHEARVPTIATMVPRGAFSFVTEKMKKTGGVKIPLCTTNRINTPETAESILASGSADLISMARPFLADPQFVLKAKQGRADEINTCIGCNQACLDHIFVGKRASCLVNPRAGHERDLIIAPASRAMKQRIAVVGAGPAGLAFATTAAGRGHKVTLFERDAVIGGQFNMAKRIPGKEEFYEALRYFKKQLELTGVDVRLGTEATPESLVAEGYNAVVMATGVSPRVIPLQVDTKKVQVASYIDVLQGRCVPGKRVAVIGAGGIGFDVADFLTHDDHTASATPSPAAAEDAEKHGKSVLKPEVDKETVEHFMASWGVDSALTHRGGVLPKAKAETPSRKVWLLQRKEGKLGAGLGKTTGWIHRLTLKKRDVEELSGCKYVRVTDEGLVIEQKGKQRTLDCDTVVICAGQEPRRELHDKLRAAVAAAVSSTSTTTTATPAATAAPAGSQGSDAAARPKAVKPPRLFLIGGAYEAGELDAKRAIDQGTRLAAAIETAHEGAVFDAPVELSHKIMKFVDMITGKK